MRIIGGMHRSRPLKSPPEDSPARPMPDMVKEALFNLLRGHFDDAGVLDLFAGNGGIGLEAVSRGARECVFVEKNRANAHTIQDNINALGEDARCRVIVGDALGGSIVAQAPRPLHLVFMDPPYDMMTQTVSRRRILEQASRLIQLLDDDGFLVLRTPWPLRNADKTEIPLTVAGAEGPETHVYRQMAVHLYAKAGVAHEDEKTPVLYADEDDDAAGGDEAQQG
jgi:16S rRNA (guanine(966)-N(2))-methyltransferase RsmD